MPDVGQSRCGQQGVHHGVCERVRVTVSDESFVVFDPHAAEDQRASFFESVRVVADADARGGISVYVG